MLSLPTAIAVVVCLPLLLLLFRRRQTRLPLPPGPKGRPFVGNALDLPKSHEWVTYAEWAKAYDSDILYLNLAGTGLIILNSISAAQELLERRSAMYSSRPRLPMLGELMGWDYCFVFMKYGPTWRKHRKMAQRSFDASSVSKFSPHITKSTHTLLRNLLRKPDEFRSSVRHMAAEVIILITYGYTIRPDFDPVVDLVERSVSNATEATTPGRFLVDVLPWLKYVPSWMPFAGFKRKAAMWKKDTIDGVEIPYQKVRDDILAGKGLDSIVADGLRNAGDDGSFEELEDVVKKVAGTMFSAGSDTTVAAILNAIFVLMAYPEVLKKARAEIDAIVQPGNLPDLNDQKSMPYLSAFIKELWRWSPVAPLGGPHFIESDDYYNGYLIPAGSIVSANAWAMAHDERVYKDPSTFNPDRFLKDGKLNPDIQDTDHLSFGWGRRVCPGKHFATMSVWLTMACIIASFDILKPVDKDGNVIEQELSWVSRGIAHPKPFKCRIIPRSPKIIEAINRTEGYEYFSA